MIACPRVDADDAHTRKIRFNEISGGLNGKERKDDGRKTSWLSSLGPPPQGEMQERAANRGKKKCALRASPRARSTMAMALMFSTRRHPSCGVTAALFLKSPLLLWWRKRGPKQHGSGGSSRWQ